MYVRLSHHETLLNFILPFTSFFYSINLFGILDHFGYKAPDFSFIHESIWYDLGRFENWLIDRRGLNLGDVVPFRSHRLPGPTFLVSDESQTSSSEEDLAISSIEKLDGIESFMAPLTEEVMKKANALLRA